MKMYSNAQSYKDMEESKKLKTMKMWKRILIIAAIVLIGLYFFGMSIHMAYGAEREWFSFMMDGKTCIEVKAIDFEHAACVLNKLAEEDKYRVAEALDSCPGILAEEYYYDFSFKECIK